MNYKIIVGLAAGLFIQAATAQNLLLNGDFNLQNITNSTDGGENYGPAPDNWTVWTYDPSSAGVWANRQVDGTYSYDGTFYMGLGNFGGAGAASGVYQIVPATAGLTYYLTVESGVQNWWWPEGEMRLFFLDASSNILNQSALQVTTGISAGDTGLPWQNYSLNATAPAGTALVKVEFAANYNTGTGGGGTVFFDNAVLTNGLGILPLPAIRIMPLGDSITWGQPVPGGYRLPLYQLLSSAGYNVQFVGTQTANSAPGLPQPNHEGWQGYRIDQIASNFLSWINAVPDPDIILLLIGTNDYGQNYDTANATNRLDQLIGLIVTNRPNAKVVVANLTLRTDSATVNNAILSTFNPYVSGVVAKHAALGQQVYFLNMQNTLIASDLSDGLHPNQTGYNKMGTNWFNTVTNLITPYGTTNPPVISRVIANPNLTNVVLTFSKPVSVSATNLANYSLDGGLTIYSATLEPSAQRDVTLMTDPQAPGTLYTLTVNDVEDNTPAHVAIAAGTAVQFRAVPPNTNAPVISDLYPDGLALFQYTNTLSFKAVSANGISTNDIVVTVDGVVVSGLTFSGTATNWTVSYSGLTRNAAHDVLITLTDIYGNSTVISSGCDTFQSGSYTWEAEDYDYNGGHYYDNPQVDAYTNLPAIAGVDFNDVNTLGVYLYRPGGTATEITADLSRPQFAGKYDYDIGYFSAGEWANYTRHYPAGTYYVWGRFAAGGGNTQCLLDRVTGGFGAINQTTNILGVFNINNSGWASFTWAPLTDANGNLVKLTFTGSTNTLRLARPDPGTGLPDVNVNFLMLSTVANPVVLNVAAADGNLSLSFPTQTGFIYQLEYKTNLTDPVWTPLGNPKSGNDTVQSLGDVPGDNARFYRIRIE